MAHSKREYVAQEKRRTRVTELYLRGYTQAAIARECHCTQPTISNDLAAIIERWRAEQLTDMAAAKAVELRKINAAEREYWAAWERSIGTHKRSSVKKSSSTKDERTELASQSEELIGDPRFLDGVMKCIERRCKLLGIDAPEKVDLNIDPWAELGEEKLAELDAQAERQNERLVLLEGFGE